MRIQCANELFGCNRFGGMLMKGKPYRDKHKKACDDPHQCLV